MLIDHLSNKLHFIKKISQSQLVVKYSKIIGNYMEKKKLSLGFLITVLIIAGSLNTLNDKFQNQQNVTEAGVPKTFYHPYVQTFIVYLSWTLTIPIYRLINPNQKHQNEPEQKEEKHYLDDKQKIAKIPIKRRKVVFYMLIDVIAGTVQGISLNFITASSYQMMRGGSIATTFLFSVIYLKKKANQFHIMGTILVVFSLFLVGLSTFLFKDSRPVNKVIQQQSLVGYILVIGSLFINGFCKTYQQKMLKTYNLTPIELLGYQGSTGLIIYSVILIVVTFIPCPFGSEACVITDNGSYFERPQVYFQQLGQNIPLLLACIFEIFSIMAFKICAITITNRLSAMTQSVFDVIRTAVIWLVAFMVTVTAGESQENYRWESTDWRIIAMQLAGFVFLVCGNLVYNQIIPVKCLKKEKLIQDQSEQVKISKSEESLFIRIR